MQWLEVKIKTFKKTASLSEKGCWCWLALWEITNKVSCDVDGLEYHLRYQTYHLWMKGLSTEREDNIFFHMFSLQKKNLIETGKSKQKQKNKDYGFFFISHCHLSGHLQPGKVNSKNQNRKSSANKSPPQKKKIQIIKPYHPKTHNSAAAPFFGGDRKKNCLSKVGTQLTLFPGTQPRDGSGGASQWSQMPNNPWWEIRSFSGKKSWTPKKMRSSMRWFLLQY